jgi:hypothetical protein
VTVVWVWMLIFSSLVAQRATSCCYVDVQGTSINIALARHLFGLHLHPAPAVLVLLITVLLPPG